MLGVAKFAIEDIPVEKPLKVFIPIEPVTDDSKLNAKLEIENDDIDNSAVEHDDPQLEVFFYYQPHSKSDFSKLEYETLSNNLLEGHASEKHHDIPEQAIITVPTEYL